MKRFTLFTFMLMAFTFVLSVVSCGIETRQRDVKVQVTSEKLDKVEKSDSLDLKIIARKRSGNNLAHSDVIVYKFVDDGCTYYVANSTTSLADGGVSVDIIHSASCSNSIHEEKRAEKSNVWK